MSVCVDPLSSQHPQMLSSLLPCQGSGHMCLDISILKCVRAARWTEQRVSPDILVYRCSLLSTPVHKALILLATMPGTPNPCSPRYSYQKKFSIISKDLKGMRKIRLNILEQIPVARNSLSRHRMKTPGKQQLAEQKRRNISPGNESDPTRKLETAERLENLNTLQRKEQSNLKKLAAVPREGSCVCQQKASPERISSSREKQ